MGSQVWTIASNSGKTIETKRRQRPIFVPCCLAIVCCATRLLKGQTKRRRFISSFDHYTDSYNITSRWLKALKIPKSGRQLACWIILTRSKKLKDKIDGVPN